jgi:hypothetical protein
MLVYLTGSKLLFMTHLLDGLLMPARSSCSTDTWRLQRDPYDFFIETCDNNGHTGFAWLREARDNAQAFANHDTYDIRGFATKLQEIAGDEAVRTAREKIRGAFDQARVSAVALGPRWPTHTGWLSGSQTTATLSGKQRIPTGSWNSIKPLAGQTI